LEETTLWKDLAEELVDEANEDAQNLEREPRAAMIGLLDEAEEKGRLEELVQTTQYLMRGDGVHAAGRALMGLALLRLERIDEATSLLTSLCSRFEQAGRWEPMAWLAAKILEVNPTLKSARFIAKAAEQAGLESLPEGSLDKAYEAYPDEHRLSYLKARTAAAAGDDATAREFLLESLGGFLQVQKADRIEEIYLELVPTAERDVLQKLFAGAVRLARRKWSLAESLFDLLLPQIKSHEGAIWAWDAFLGVLPKVPEGQNALRRYLRAVASKAFPDVEDIDSVLLGSGIFDEGIKVEAAIRNIKALLGLAPGYYVLHANSGIGRIVSNDGESLTIDFQERQGHRMSLDLATRALEVLPPDDMRVLALGKPEELKRLANEEPEKVVFLALREAGGQANTSALKRRITNGVIAPSRWTTWWKETKPLLEGHPRIDTSMAFKNTYQILEIGEMDQEISLPSMDRKRGIRANINLIRRFLEQHPGAKVPSGRIHAPILKMWVHDERTRAEDRVALYLFLESNYGILEVGKDKAICEALQGGFEPAELTEESHQASVVRSGLANCDSDRDAILFGLASRHDSVRAIAVGQLRKDPHKAGSILAELLRNPDQRPAAALALIQQSIQAEETDTIWPPLWDVAAGAALLGEKTTRDTVRRQALALFDPHGPLAARLKRIPAPEEAVSRWSLLLNRWQSSERALSHVYDFLTEVGLLRAVEEARSVRKAATKRALLVGKLSLDIHGTPMTRATYKSHEAERDKLAMSLKTEVPEVIRKARELGDLSENAEYDAAKLRQAQETGRLATLSKMLQEAQIIDDMRIPDGQAGPGTEVVLEEESTGAREVHWILGEGDSNLGADVISVMAPLGQGLLGRQQGDTIAQEGADGPRVLKIIEVRRRLP
jgi:transcription elongation factor GreA